LTLAQAAELLGTGIKEFRTQLTKNHFATGVARQWADSDGSTRVRVMVYKFQTAQDANAFGAFIKDIFDRATAAFESESTVTGIAVSACWATKKRDNNGDFVGAGYGLRGEIVVLLSAWSPDRDAVVVATKGTMLRQYGRLS